MATDKTFTLIHLPGNFAKVQIDGVTKVRVHALTDGTWTTGSKAATKFNHELAALAWLRSAAIMVAAEAMLS